jgi:hypothetical protein
VPGPEDERPDADDRERAYGLGRLLALSDGVFAFALTLLVLQLAIPVVPRISCRLVGPSLDRRLARQPRWRAFVTPAVFFLYILSRRG